MVVVTLKDGVGFQYFSVMKTARATLVVQSVGVVLCVLVCVGVGTYCHTMTSRTTLVVSESRCGALRARLWCSPIRWHITRSSQSQGDVREIPSAFLHVCR